MEKYMKHVSYLQARDPSILAWNRAGLIPVNLATAGLIDESTQVITEKPSDRIEVYLRVKSIEENTKFYEIKENELICKLQEYTHNARKMAEGVNAEIAYKFSKIFAPKSTQAEIFDYAVKRKLVNFINGEHSTIFTYGTSGSGKTYTIVGTPNDPGIIPRALEYLFRSLQDLPGCPEVILLPNGDIEYFEEQKFLKLEQKKRTILSSTWRDKESYIRVYKSMQERLSGESTAKLEMLGDVRTSIWVSFAEVYNEQIFDLLDVNLHKNQRTKLKLGYNKDEVFIRDLTWLNVIDGVEAFQILQYGLQNLNYAATGLNSRSSRSHGIFTVKLVQYCNSENATIVSSFQFCDLAGSERVKKTFNVGDRLEESKNINKSLHVLGRCIENIRAVQKGKTNIMVPYRESKLTQVFQNVLKFSENISLIINLNPSNTMTEESRHALEFSAISRDIRIQEKPTRTVQVKNRFSEMLQQHGIINEDDHNIILEEKARLEEMVDQLTNEIEQLKLEKELEVIEAKTYVQNLYKQFIKEKVERDNAVKEREKQRLREKYDYEIKRLKEIIQELKVKSEYSRDVINISSSSSDDSFVQKVEYDDANIEVETLKNENELLQQENDRLKSFIETLESKLSDKDEIISDAIRTTSTLQKELNQMQQFKKLYLELLKKDLMRPTNTFGDCCLDFSDSESDGSDIVKKKDF